MLKAYTYKNCSTCRKAVKFLKDHGVEFQEIPIRETPPSLAELRTMLAAQDGNLRRLFNTSGGDYKALGLSTKLSTLSVDEALKLLEGNGNLVKRPFLIGKGVALTGFDEKTWSQALG